MTPLQILKQHWGYDAFRPLQQEIVESVLAGHDTLAILPTGGGKSICFQVPGLLLDGLCLVISPLIALMKDQVEQLQKRGIKAVAIHAGMSRSEIDITLDNCVYGDVKFLYLSPERLQSELFMQRLTKMKIGLLAVDEAHCISQWGYDFRPSYLQIGTLRSQLSGCPVIALTASATPEVKDDICEKLLFKPSQQVFQQSFARKNLSYSCLAVEDKETRLLQIIKQVPGSGIVYVRSRNRTAQIAAWLKKNKISAAHYHAGLPYPQRTAVQQDWLRGKVRIMVATNAFGMGIDKPDVRLVVHLDLPETIEAYYQEAGRAGRDGRYAYAVLLFGPKDAEQLLEKTEEAHPEPAFLKQLYQTLANYYQLATGSGLLQSFPFQLEAFANYAGLTAGKVYNGLAALETEGFLQLSAGFYTPSKVLFNLNPTALYEYQLANPQLDPLIKLLLRLYGGQLFSHFTTISEQQIAAELKVSTDKINTGIKTLAKAAILDYQASADAPQLTFTTSRFSADALPLNTARLNTLKKRALQKANAMVVYVQHTLRCRTQLLLVYFGEESNTLCRICDFCIAHRKAQGQQLSEVELHQLKTYLAKHKSVHPAELLQAFEPSLKPKLLQQLNSWLETDELRYTEEGTLIWKD